MPPPPPPPSRVGSLLDGHISLRVRGGGALFATNLSAFLSSPPILSLDIPSVANKDSLSELCSLKRHDQHPVTCEALGGRPECQSKLISKCIHSFDGRGMCIFVLYLKVRLSPQLFTLGLFHKSTSGKYTRTCIVVTINFFHSHQRQYSHYCDQNVH